MVVLSKNGEGAEVGLTRDELIMLNNAMNEVCNGVHIDDDEFQTRLAFERNEIRALLEQVSEVLK